MEGRGLKSHPSTVSVGVLILGLLVAQTQVMAQEQNCCRTTGMNVCYFHCRSKGTSQSECGNVCNCKCTDKEVHSVNHVHEEAHTHVKGYNVNCATTPGRLCFEKCRLTPELCAQRCVCTLTKPDYNINCLTADARKCYNICRLPRELCLKKCGCALADISHYCKLGCASSVCNTISAPRKSEEEVEHCKNACSEFCIKGANIAMITA